jgi:hypothetical protein
LIATKNAKSHKKVRIACSHFFVTFCAFRGEIWPQLCRCSGRSRSVLVALVRFFLAPCVVFLTILRFEVTVYASFGLFDFAAKLSISPRLATKWDDFQHVHRV